MKYFCLRDCYVNDRLYHKDVIYDLPDGFPIYEKNFVDASTVKIEPEPALPVSPLRPAKDHVDEVDVSGEAKEVTPWVDPAKPILCEICQLPCKSRAGLKLHMKTHKKK